MRPTTIRVALALAAALSASAAAAEAPAYVGTWAGDLAQCKISQEKAEAPLVLAKDRYDQHEAHCAFKSVTGTGPDWNVAAECTVEGAAQAYEFTLTVSGDTLTVTDETGARDLLRCK